MKILLEADRSGYSIEQVGRTMTVRELIDFLESRYDDEDEIYISNDNGFTYGAITEYKFREAVEDEEDEEEEDE